MAELRALVIDDNEMTRNLYAEILKEKQVRVFAYADPTEFMDKCPEVRCRKQKPCFDAILTDNKMPQMTGLAFLQQIAGMGCLVPKEQTAIVSGDWSSEDLKKARKLGCRIFEKPCTIELIMDWVDTLQLISE
jgi:CheY-like chemotaxis protein